MDWYMPRPSKRVSPDTLGGRIRAARQEMRLSLAEVAGERYSTSLISQIERNRVDPSQESLHYLAERLQLPIEDLTALAQQHRESEVEASRYKVNDERRLQAQQLLMSNRPREALKSLEEVDVVQIPGHLRWRLAALRGQCYFNLREFRQSQYNFLYAMAEKPPIVPSDQAQEAMLLALHLAAASRELGQLDEAARYYQIALEMMDASTSLRYIAEAHWGVALVLFEQARTSLRGVLDAWRPKLDEGVEATPAGRRRKQERANVVSAAACYLAGVEFEAGNYEAARNYVEQAQEAGKESYILRRAEASMMLGKILEAQSAEDPECDGKAAEEAFQQAINELEKTDRVAAKIKALDLLGRHLLKKGKVAEGEKVLDRARRLSQFVPTESAITPESDNAS